MNRIRIQNSEYQVLVSPSMDYMLGQWTDFHIGKFSVEKYGTLNEAQIRAYELSDIDWHRLVELHKIDYSVLTNLIKKTLDKDSFIYDFYPHLKSPEELKNHFFDSVLLAQESDTMFNIPTFINDVITIQIVNPWTKNLIEMANVLKYINKLGIERIEKQKGVLFCYGKTSVNTYYKIELWGSILYQAKQWHQINVIGSPNKVKYSNKIFKNAREMQKMVDESGFYIR